MVTLPDKPIVLMGFMGSGKSTLGKQIARSLKLNFTDLDKYIESKTGKSVQEIFSVEGEKSFRNLEGKYLAELLDQPSGVIAIGGGAPCNDENIKLIKERSRSVYLKISVPELYLRISLSQTARPLMAGKTGAEMESYIYTLLETREKYYNQADMIMESDCITYDKLLKTILPSV
ncbi:MAG: shikimate kinase [Bacteroidota bacterium]